MYMDACTLSENAGYIWTCVPFRTDNHSEQMILQNRSSQVSRIYAVASPSPVKNRSRTMYSTTSFSISEFIAWRFICSLSAMTRFHKICLGLPWLRDGKRTIWAFWQDSYLVLYFWYEKDALPQISSFPFKMKRNGNNGKLFVNLFVGYYIFFKRGGHFRKYSIKQSIIIFITGW